MKKKGRKIHSGKIKSQILHASIKLMEQYFTGLVLNDTADCINSYIVEFSKNNPRFMNWNEYEDMVWLRYQNVGVHGR